MTRREAIDRINKASAIYVRPSVGVSERWVKIAKREAEYILRGFEPEGPICVELDQNDRNEIYMS